MIVLDQVSKHYDDVIALDETDLQVTKGEFVTLLGSSGSGKTTLLNVIAGMVRPTTGRVFIDGQDLTRAPSNQRNIGMVFQNYALMPHMTIFENIAFPLRIRRATNAEIRKRVAEVLDIVQLPHVGNRKPSELSGGQQQRISLGRCIAYNPSLVLMDEPLGALDRRLREQMQIEIKKIQSELGITMLYVTHDQEEALSMSDRIALMEKGRIVQVGTPRELYFKPKSVFAATFLGTSNILRGELSAGSQNVLVLRTGERIALVDGCTTGKVGEMSVLVRPESMAINHNGDRGTLNSLTGLLKMSVMLGATTNHYVELGDGTTLVSEELTSQDSVLPALGTRVTLSWKPSATVPITA